MVARFWRRSPATCLGKIFSASIAAARLHEREQQAREPPFRSWIGASRAEGPADIGVAA